MFRVGVIAKIKADGLGNWFSATDANRTSKLKLRQFSNYQQIFAPKAFPFLFPNWSNFSISVRLFSYPIICIERRILGLLGVGSTNEPSSGYYLILDDLSANFILRLLWSSRMKARKSFPDGEVSSPSGVTMRCLCINLKVLHVVSLTFPPLNSNFPSLSSVDVVFFFRFSQALALSLRFSGSQVASRGT